MQSANRKTVVQRVHRSSARPSRHFTSPHVTIQIPKECLDGEMLQEMHFALWCAAQRARERGEPEGRALALEAVSESLEGLEYAVNRSLARHGGEIVASEIPDRGW